MLSPRYLDGVADELIEIYSQLESDILQDMARRIARLSKITESTKWQASVLAETGALKKDVIKIIKQYDTQIQDELLAVFNDAVEKSTKADNKIFKDAIGKEVTEKNTQLMLANIQKTRADLSRLTITTAYDTEKMFVQQANNAYMQTVSGAFDYDTAMKNACDNLAKDGITSVFYKNTKPVRLTIESAVRMNILTGINQTAATITQNNCIELGCDLVETSAHIGARPEHEEWQGQIFSLSGTSDKYKPFSVCRLGEATGICGINCRHSYYPYFEGLEKHYTQDDLDEMASQTVEYNGQKMTRYEGEQNLRHIERNIRKYKRQALTQQAGGVDSTQARTKLGQWQAKARDFTKQTGIKRDSAREYIGTDGKQPRGIKPTASQKVTVGAKPTKATATSTATATASKTTTSTVATTASATTNTGNAQTTTATSTIATATTETSTTTTKNNATTTNTPTSSTLINTGKKTQLPTLQYETVYEDSASSAVVTREISKVRPEDKANIEAAIIYAKAKGVKVDLVTPSNTEKSADAIVIDKKLEIKTSETASISSIDNLLRDASHGQSNDILLRLKRSIDDRTLKLTILSRVKRSKIESITIIDVNDNVSTYTRNEILKLSSLIKK